MIGFTEIKTRLYICLQTQYLPESKYFFHRFYIFTMKILHTHNQIQPYKINFSKSKHITATTNAHPSEQESTDLATMPFYVAFKSHSDKENLKAKSYLEETMPKLQELYDDEISITDFDLDKLNGIQSGIKVFEGMNMKEIAFVMNNLLEVAVFRGCYNNCAHCYADGTHPIKETPDQTAKMDWEDFKQLTEGIKELNKRLGFNICKQIGNEEQYMTAFHDSDCSQIYLKDEDGNFHDWTDIAKNLYEATGIPQIFDTAGWYLEDKSAQLRMEKYIQETLNSKNNDYFLDFSISANPYHAQHFRAVEHMKNGNKLKEEFFREKDTNRVANMLFTLTPMLKGKEKVRFNARAMNAKSKNSEGLTADDLLTSYERYLKKLKELYKADLNGEQKVIKNEKQIKDYLHKYKKLLTDISTTPTVSRKLKDIYDSEDPAVKNTLENIFDNPEKAIHESFVTMIDANGDIYMTNFYETYKLDLHFNFNNNHKKTQPIAPNLSEKLVNKELINRHMENINNS